MMYLPDRLTLWLAWIALISAVCMAFPLGPMGLLGWMAAVGPLLHRIAPSIGARRMGAVGLVMIGATILLSAELHWYEMVLPPMLFLFGLLLAPVPITGYQDPGSEWSSANAEHLFRLALTREVGRARRHERPLTLISVACGEADDLQMLEAAIASQVHIYAQIFPVEDRLMVIVPELDKPDYAALEARVLQAARERHLHTLSLGVASFPAGECTASGLVDAVAEQRVFALGRSQADSGDNAKATDDVGSGLPYS
jgi:hypothetical protein